MSQELGRREASVRRRPPAGLLLAGAIGIALAWACSCSTSEPCDPYTQPTCSLSCSTMTFGPYEDESYQDQYVFVGGFGGGSPEGTARSPYRHVGPAIHAAARRGIGTVLVAPGTYTEEIVLDARDSGVVVVPACAKPDTVLLQSREGAPLLRVEGDAETRVGFGGLLFYSHEGPGIEITGGRLSLSNITLLEAVGVGLLAEGPESVIELDDVRIEGVEEDTAGNGFGVLLSDGARLVGSRLEVAGPARAGLIAQGEETSFHLIATTISGLLPGMTPPEPDDAPDMPGEGPAGMLLLEGARGILNEATLSDVWGVGLQLEQGSAISLQDVEIEGVNLLQNGPDDLAGSGVLVLGGSSLVAYQLSIARTSEFGLAADQGSTIELEEARIADIAGLTGDPAAGIGLAVLGGSVLEASGLLLERTQVFGVAASGPSSELWLTDVDILDTAPSKASALGGGLLVDDGASATLERVTIEGSHGFGILAANSAMTLLDVEIHDTLRSSANSMAVGLLADAGSQVQARGLQVRRTEGTGLAAWSAELSCEDCVLTRNAFAGLAAVGARVEVTSARIAGTGPDATTGGGYGIFADSRAYPTELVLRGSTVEDHSLSAVFLAGRTMATLEDNVLVGGPVGRSLWPTGTAVFASDTVAGPYGVRLIGNTLRDSEGGGLFLDGATASLNGNTWTGNAVDLVQQLCDGVLPPPGLEEEALGTVQLCPPYDQPVELLEFALDYETLSLE